MRFLARRLRDDFKTGFQRIVALDQVQRGFAAAEQLGEQPLEMVVDGLERRQQPFARFAVETLDALPQPLDRFDQVVALGGECGVLGLDLAQFFLGTQIDGAEPFAVAAQLFQVLLDLRQCRQFGLRRDLREAGHGLRLDFQHVVDLALDIGKAAPGPFHALFGTRGCFARAGQGFERSLGGAIGFRHCGFRCRQRIGCRTTVVFGELDFADQRAALLGEYRRRILKLGALGRDFGDAGFDGGELRSCALHAVLPLGLLGDDGLQAAVRQFGLARQCLRFGPNLCGKAAMALDIGANRGQFRLGFDARGQFVECRCRGLMRSFGLAAVGSEAGMRLGQCRFARRVAIDLAFGIGMAFARRISFALGGAPGFTGRRFSGGRSLQPGLGCFQHLSFGGGVDAGLFQLMLDIDQTRALGEPPRGAGRGMGGGDKTVPAPDVAFQRYQPLAGLQLRDQRRTAFLGNDPDLRQAARQFRRRLNVRGERLDAIRQGRIAFADTGIGPAHRCGGIDRRIEIVAQYGADGFLIALGDGDAIDDRRPQILGLAVHQL